MADTIARAIRAKEPALVEVVAVGVDDGADALAGLLCARPAGLAAAVLFRPNRLWVDRSPSAGAEGNGGIAVLIVVPPGGFAWVAATGEMLESSGSCVSVVAASGALDAAIAVGRRWLQREPQGKEGDGEA